MQKVGKDSARPVEIDNSIDGLRAYLSALNIRNKCKHPLFLVLRFDSCVALAYDATAVNNPAEDDGAFHHMMQAISGRAARAPSSGGKSAARMLPFVVAVKGDHGEETCTRADCPVRLSAGLSLPHASTLPATYKLICDRQLAALRKSYCRLHCTQSASPIVPHAPSTLATLEGAAGGNDDPVQGYAAKPATAFPLCDSCMVPHPIEAPRPTDAAGAAAQRDATVLLESVRHMASATMSAQGPCPEHEWQQGLRIISEAMAMHCRTRSAAEIFAFMHDEVASGGKRAATATKVSPFAFDHSHSTPTMTCDPAFCDFEEPNSLTLPPSWMLEEEYDAADIFGTSMMHSHSH
jgi:hypothetical protein